MIEDCIIDKTNLFEIKLDSITEFNINEVDKYNTIAKKISEETGVPKELIYKAPCFSFIENWHKINGEWYFYKSDGYDFHFINELLGEVVSNYFELDTTHYKVAKLSVAGKKEEYGLVSKNFCDNKYTYKRCWDYSFEPRRDLSILKKIRNICHSKEEYQLLLDDFKKFFIRDLYTSQLDRSGNNFLFKITPEGIRLAPLYDYEWSFKDIERHFYRNQIAEINLSNIETQSILKNDIKFQELLHSIILANMSSFIDEVEDNHKILIPKDYKERYKERDTKIKKLILDNKLIK